MRKKRAGFFGNLKKGLSKSRQALSLPLSRLKEKFTSLSQDFWGELEETLIRADLGVKTTTKILESLRVKAKEKKLKEPQEVLTLFQEELVNYFPNEPFSWLEKGKLNIILGVGINGTGKTTTLAKLAHQAQKMGKKVLLAAADTFRAAAIEQLEIWGEKLGVEVIKHQRGGDAAAVVYDAIKAALARGIDLLLVDTAGRLHTYQPLMEELKKVKRIAEREALTAASKGKEVTLKTWLILDATHGQNAFSQTNLFNEALGLDALILAKLDGTAKGGIAVALAEEFKIPIVFLGVGENLEDLLEFRSQEFVQSLLSRFRKMVNG